MDDEGYVPFVARTTGGSVPLTAATAITSAMSTTTAVPTTTTPTTLMASRPADTFRNVREVTKANPRYSSIRDAGEHDLALAGKEMSSRDQRLAVDRYEGGMVFEKVFSFEHLFNAACACCNNVRWKASTQLFENAILEWVANTRRQLLDGSYKSKGFNSFYIMERGKLRHIQSVHISERMVQKCLVQYCLRPLIQPRLIVDNCATLPGRGTDYAINRLKEHLSWWYLRHGRDGYIDIMDYHDYFNSILHEKLLVMYALLPMDSRLFNLVKYFIDCFDGDSGLGLGSEISQISAVFYTNEIDHMIKDKYGFHCYGRYMDDSYIIGSQDDISDVKIELKRKLADFGLKMNEKVTTTVPLTQGFHYLKKRFFISESGKIITRLERKNVKRERRRLKKNIELINSGLMGLDSEASSWESWKSYATKYNSYRTVQSVYYDRMRLLKPYLQ